MSFTDRDILSEGFIERFERRYPVHILETLLCDRTTGRNIIWADNEYEVLGDGYKGDDEITIEKITGLNSGVIKPRIAKERERQSQRTKSHAEVFTPSWLCNQMINDIDAVWFGRRNVFNFEGAQDWEPNPEPVAFPKKKGHGWHAYIESPRLEITCGEAPFACSRYDTVTGITLPVGERIGFLDRKLRVVTEKTKTRKEWMRQALNALAASYGFEYQGDNLLIARINVLETFYEHYIDRWGESPSGEELDRAAWIVSWNFWQMNGLTDAVPTNAIDVVFESTLGSFEEPEPRPVQTSLFDLLDDVFAEEQVEETEAAELEEKIPFCVVYDWINDEPFEFASLKRKRCSMGKKFYAVIGNPPYQEQQEGDNKQYAPPVYHHFMDEAYKVGDRVELITPARFLFNAGSTPKAWNQKMLADERLKVLYYEANSANVFSDQDIKGGVAVTYRNSQECYGAIEQFVPIDELRSILDKVKRAKNESLQTIVYPSETYRFTEAMHRDYPTAESLLSKGHKYDFKTSIFKSLGDLIFSETNPNDQSSHESNNPQYVQILGLVDGKRVRRWIKRDYVEGPDNFEVYKVILPAANGSGAIGEVLSTPLIGEPLIGHTQTFISIGKFETEVEATACLKYIKSKFARVMLGILKITQHNPPAKWKYVPLQDFTSNSDIDWSQSVADIDKQLYAKYSLDEKEIAFIELHVKEMD